MEDRSVFCEVRCTWGWCNALGNVRQEVISMSVGDGRICWTLSMTVSSTRGESTVGFSVHYDVTSPLATQQAVFLSQLEQLQVRHCSASSAATALNSLSSTNMQTNVSRVLGIQIYSCWNSFETLPPRHSYWTNLNKVVGATPRAMLPSNFLVADSSSLFG